jgi:uncharacterized membrane protein YkoI
MIKNSLMTLLFVALISLPATANAQQKNKDTPVKSSAQAAARAQNQVDGRVLKVSKKSDKYRVKMLKKSGRVVTVDVDKRSGKVKTSKSKDE